MYLVKRLGKNGMWSAVSLIDDNGSFRGEAKFDTREEAIAYMSKYLDRMKDRIKKSPEGYGEIKIFDNDKPIESVKKGKPSNTKTKSKAKNKSYEKQKKKTKEFTLRF